MPRLPRPVADGLLYHAINRGNNRAAVFASAADFQAFLDALRQTQRRYPFRLFGYSAAAAVVEVGTHALDGAGIGCGASFAGQWPAVRGRGVGAGNGRRVGSAALPATARAFRRSNHITL